MKFTARLWAVFDRLLDFLAAVAIILLVCIWFLICVEVSLRYFLHTSWFGGEIEVSAYMLMWIAFLTIAWLLREEGHVRIEAVINRLNPRTANIVNAATSFLGTASWLVFAFYSAQRVWIFIQMDEYLLGVLMAPSAVVCVIIPVGSFLLCIQFARRTYGYLSRWRI